MFCHEIMPINESWVCSCCEELIEPVKPPVCKYCGRPLAASGICPECLSRGRLIQNTALFTYTEPYRDAILRFKYAGLPRYANGFAMLIERYLDKTQFSGIEALLPVPMHKAKKRKRGYNQAEALAAALSAWLEKPCLTDYLIRLYDTKPQSGLTAAGRAKNLASAFELKGQTAFKAFLIIDDIYTTGETISACSSKLFEGGALHVESLTLAVTLPQNSRLLNSL
jgi:ComF family protein